MGRKFISTTASGRALRSAFALLIALTVALPASANLNSALAAIEIQTIDLRETNGGAELTLQASGPLVWTQYRNDAGELVVELPNTVLAGQVLPPAPRGLVASVVLEPETAGVRPLTRMVVATNHDADHTLFVTDEGLLTLSFDSGTAPSGIGSAGALADTGAVAASSSTVAIAEPRASETLPEPSVPESSVPESTAVATLEPAPASASEPMAPTTPAAFASSGSPEEPSQGPEPQGVPATRLLAVEIVDLDGTSALRIRGDGEFSYSTFRLENPPRFVIDLDGVVHSAGVASVPVGSDYVEQVRLAQFRPYPSPVSRVVLDLVGDADPLLDGASDGLWVLFSTETRMTDAGSTGSADEAGAATGAEPMEVASAGEPSESMAEAPAEVAVSEPMSTASGPVEVPALPGADDSATSSPMAEPAMEMADAEAADDAFSYADETEPAVAEAAPAELEPMEVTAAEPLYAAEDETSSEPAAPLFADDDFDPEPLQIADDSRRESPANNDVALFEAQQVQIPPADVQRSAPQGFAVQRLDTETRFVGEPITLTVKDAELSEVLRTIARYADLNLVLEPGVGQPVTIEFVGVPWDQALDAILKIQRLDKQLEGNILRVASKDLFREEAVEDQELAQARALSVPLSTVIKRLSYADAAAVAGILTRGQRNQGGGSGFGGRGLSFRDTGILSRRGSVNVDQRTNTLILKELPSYLETVIQVIENLDIPEKQVMIEARVVETTRNFSRSLGIDWNFLGVANQQSGNSTGLQFPNRVETGGGVQLLTGGDNGFFNLSLGNVLNTFQIDLALQAAENEGLINVISSPKIATLNNNAAEIETGLQLPVQTVVGGGGTTAGGAVNPFGTVSVNFIRASLRLRVTPQVTFEGTILMTVNIEKDEPQFALQVPGAPTAPIATRRASTRVRVADGGTAVIGGIYQVSANEGEGRVPGLARIPVLGQLFKNRNRTNQNQELLIFITPRVIQQ